MLKVKWVSLSTLLILLILFLLKNANVPGSETIPIVPRIMSEPKSMKWYKPFLKDIRALPPGDDKIDDIQKYLELDPWNRFQDFSIGFTGLKILADSYTVIAGPGVVEHHIHIKNENDNPVHVRDINNHLLYWGMGNKSFKIPAKGDKWIIILYMPIKMMNRIVDWIDKGWLQGNYTWILKYRRYFYSEYYMPTFILKDDTMVLMWAGAFDKDYEDIEKILDKLTPVRARMYLKPYATDAAYYHDPSPYVIAEIFPYPFGLRLEAVKINLKKKTMPLQEYLNKHPRITKLWINIMVSEIEKNLEAIRRTFPLEVKAFSENYTIKYTVINNWEKTIYLRGTCAGMYDFCLDIVKRGYARLKPHYDPELGYELKPGKKASFVLYLTVSPGDLPWKNVRMFNAFKPGRHYFQVYISIKINRFEKFKHTSDVIIVDTHYKIEK